MNPETSAAIQKIIDGLDTKNDSVVITSAEPGHNILYVTQAWQDMCGFSEAEAVGRNPRLTQGPGTDTEVARSVGKAIAQNKACKFQLINYRGGSTAFWNVVSIMPVIALDKVCCFVATLKDYSYHLTKLVKLNPPQFFKQACSYQSSWPLLDQYRHPRHPCVIYSGQDAQGTSQSSDALVAKDRMPLFVKRLGWSGLQLEPEYLHIRIQDAFAQLGITYTQETSDSVQGELFNVIGTAQNGLVCRVVVACEDGSDHYRIDITRLKGNTFDFHSNYRLLKSKMQDIIDLSSPGPTPLCRNGGFQNPQAMQLLQLQQQGVQQVGDQSNEPMQM